MDTERPNIGDDFLDARIVSRPEPFHETDPRNSRYDLRLRLLRPRAFQWRLHTISPRAASSALASSPWSAALWLSSHSARSVNPFSSETRGSHPRTSRASEMS